MTATEVALSESFAASGPGLRGACAHCGLPVPSYRKEAEDVPSFCCGGCRTAFAVIHEAGLGQYYRLPERRLAAVPASDHPFDEFDHAAFRDLHVRRRADGRAEIDLYLEGVHCSSCVWLIERVPLTLPGMVEAVLDLRRSLVHVVWDDTVLRLSTIARFLDTLGYRAHPFRGVRRNAMRRAEDRAALARIGVAGAIAGNVMTVAIALYAGWFGGMEHTVTHYFRWVSLLLTTPALLWPGQTFFRGAWAALRLRTLHMDVPIALALAAGFARGTWNTWTGSGPIYFDGVATLVFLLLVGRFLQQRAQRVAVDASELRASLAPSVARVLEGDGVREVPIEALLPGMVVEVRAGDTLAADGIVIRGASDMDTSLLTGESRPARVAPGARVFAGTINLSQRLEVSIEQAGESSRVGRLLADVESGTARRAPIVQLADRLAGRFVAVVLVLAVATALLWLRLDPSRALDNAIALLIVTCPCALALATPLAVTVGIGRAARSGILIKGGDALEALARPGLLFLDKTGTVTEGRTRLASWSGDAVTRTWVLALERHSNHPIAGGFRAAWPDLVAPEADDVSQTLGGGIEGTVEGRHVVVGSPTFVHARMGWTESHTATDPSHTPIWVAVDGSLVARAAFWDPLRPEAAAAIAALRGRGWRVRLLSGDDPALVRRVGEQLGLAPGDCRGGATPEDKLAVIAEAALREPVVMVGDGVNDAAAIAHATAGVGVHGGMEACLAAADVYLARPGLEPLVRLIDGAERTLGVVRRNIAFSLVYNVIGAALAIAGVINPLLAAILMPASSLTVVLASWLGRTFEPAP